MTNRFTTLTLLSLLTVSPFGCARSKQVSITDQTASFASPQKAADALKVAAEASDNKGLEKIFGMNGMKLFDSGDAVADKNARAEFIGRMAEKYAVEPLPGADGQYQLVVGNVEWPFPVPLVEGKTGWHFDIVEGAEEILDRRVGENELKTIRALRIYVEAQKQYHRVDHDGDGVKEYAQRLASTEGKHDGLYWKSTGAKDASPLGPLVAEAVAEGYRKNSSEPIPFHGYYFKRLFEQGPGAPGGAKNYVDGRGNMTKGFALYAYPVRWGMSGIMSFMVGPDGVIYQKDLGLQTLAEANQITKFDPTSGWTPVSDAGEDEIEQ